jgi:hypothetical protein
MHKSFTYYQKQLCLTEECVCGKKLACQYILYFQHFYVWCSRGYHSLNCTFLHRLSVSNWISIILLFLFFVGVFSFRRLMVFNISLDLPSLPWSFQLRSYVTVNFIPVSIIAFRLIYIHWQGVHFFGFYWCFKINLTVKMQLICLINQCR